MILPAAHDREATMPGVKTPLPPLVSTETDPLDLQTTPRSITVVSFAQMLNLFGFPHC
jgi:hypothetical protein